MVEVSDGRRWRTTVDHHRTTGQRWLIGRSGRVMGRVWIGSGLGLPGLNQVWAGSGSGRPRGMPRVSHVCTRVSHVDADVDIITTRESNPGPLAQRLKGYPKSQLS
nr:hypothetical protein [Tanacetum cinerariifolium]